MTAAAVISALAGVRFGPFAVVFLVPFALGAAALFTRHLTRPLQGLRQALRALARGEEPPRIAEQSDDELVELASGLNRMVETFTRRLQHHREEQSQLEAALDTMVEGVMVLDSDGRIVRINRAVERMFRLRDAEVTGRPAVEIARHHPLITLIRSVLRTRTDQAAELTLPGPPERIARVQASVARGREGIHAVLVFHDISELKRLERVRKDFVANLSHELRTPLSSIKGYVEALIDGAKDHPRQGAEFLEVLRQQTDRLDRLITDLLTLSQIESGQYAWRQEPVRLDEITRHTVVLLRPIAEKKGHAMIEELKEVAPISGDGEKLAQAVANLVDNAVKYTPPGGTITLRTESAGGAVTLRVMDTGIGIPAQDLDRIFERFYRVDRARSREEGGTGLGLSIVRHIAEAHGGAVSVESYPGKGSTFTLSFPLAR